MDVFDDIRPFHDHEVQPILKSLISDEQFLSIAAKLLFQHVTLSGPEIKSFLNEKTQHLDSVERVQRELVSVYVENIVKQSTDGFTVSGLEQLDLDLPHLFISNHRDIALDSALLNIALYRQGAKTARIATGDNLKSIDGVTDLMRLNKAFFVRRSVTGGKALVRALKQLSEYIQYSICNDHEAVWIAQREGRAKDGNDLTSAAVLKMLAMSRDRNLSFKDHFDALKIVPVCLSYEYDPCDVDKAREVYQQDNGGYAKQENEDIFTIGKGLTQYKGRVHLTFGRPVTEPFSNAEQLAQLIDRQILSNYKFYPANVIAYESLFGPVDQINLLGATICEDKRQFFAKRLAEAPQELQDYILKMYAAPVRSYLALG